MRVYAVILAAGRGERFGSDKVLEPLGGRPVWKWSYDLFRSCTEIAGVGLVCSAANLESIRALASDATFIVEGGSNRQESSRIGVQDCEGADAVLIHDGARPFVSSELLFRVLEGLKAGAAAAAIPVVDTLRIRQTGAVVPREELVAMQTPQGARRDWLLEAHRQADQIYTDDVALLQAAGYRVKLVDGDPENFKITTQYDLARARRAVSETRTGLGYDVHRFSSDPERRLYLGGVHFPEGPSLEGHSDADVVLHSVVDALLGAAALGDIGQHFPPSEARWRGESSLTFLRHAAGLLAEGGWSVANVDVAILAERPRVMGRAVEMRECMAGVLGISVDRVSVKATTNEGLGSIGRGEGIAAFATATIVRR